ncbi:hypothetical protein HID58_074134, partial [Brassica napus]
ALVVERVARNYFQDLYGLFASSKSMKALAEQRGRQCLYLWHIDMTKEDNMCERCFWIKEIGTFLRDFEPISVIRDTRKW